MISNSAKKDVRKRKQYILRKFKYREYAEHFSWKIKRAILELEIYPKGYTTTGFQHRGYDIYIRPCDTYLLFYVVSDIGRKVTVLRILHEREDWEYIVQMWINND